MLDEMVEEVLPGGLWLLAGLAIGVAFAEALRPVAVRAVRVGMDVADRAQEVGAEAYEKAQDLIAEARHERGRVRVPAARPDGAGRPTVRPSQRTGRSRVS
ncbi:MAG TPA: hypothetical protein VKF14_12830 [Candidatus Dormibacteraeota bacterium]|nr:hypothetical protein [Candidatus Dormibacteraeota bacterium]